MTTTDLNNPELRLPKPPGMFRRWLAAHPRFVDGGIVVTYLFGCAMMLLFEVFNDISMQQIVELEDPDAVATLQQNSAVFGWPWALVLIAITLLTALALAYRRRFPFAGLIVVAFLFFFEQGMLVVPNSVALVFMLYAVPVYRSVRAGWFALAFAVLSQTVLALFTNASSGGFVGPVGFVTAGPLELRDSLIVSLMNAIWLLAVLMIAINLGNRRRYVEALIDRAHQLAREREQRAQLAAAEERSRIAREMHDIVAHSLSVVVTLSEAASVAVGTQPEAAANAMARAAETGRSALMEMRRLLGVLNEGEGSAETLEEMATESTDENLAAPRSPQPGMAQMRELIDGFRQAGLRVELTESGIPGDDATHQLAVYRIVQEALTNSLRYAGRGSEVKILISHDGESTTIEVIDSGRRGTADETTNKVIPGSGRGLTGATERARMFGGSLESKAHGAGWRLHAVVPTGATRNTITRALKETTNER